jgi:hypothetical protein
MDEILSYDEKAYHVLLNEFERRKNYYWQQKNGTLVNVKEMSDTHLVNTIKLLKTRMEEAELYSYCDIDEIIFGD